MINGAARTRCPTSCASAGFRPTPWHVGSNKLPHEKIGKVSSTCITSTAPTPYTLCHRSPRPVPYAALHPVPPLAIAPHPGTWGRTHFHTKNWESLVTLNYLTD